MKIQSLFLAVFTVIPVSVFGQTATWNNTATGFNSAGSWTASGGGAAPPDSSTTAVIINPTQVPSMSADASILGLTTGTVGTPASSNWTLGQSGSRTLTIGSGGVNSIGNSSVIITLNPAVTLGASSTFDIGGQTSHEFRLNGAFNQNNQVLSKTGIGQLRFLTASTFNAGINLNGGILRFSNTSYSLGGAVTMGAAAQLRIDGAANTLTLAGGLTQGTNGLTLEGGGTLVINGAYSGSSTISILGSTSLAFGTTANIGGAITGTSGGFSVNSGGNVTLSSASNTFTGNTTVNSGGTLNVSADANLGNAANSVALAGGTLVNTGSLSSARTLNLNAGGGSLASIADQTATFSGVVQGSNALTIGTAANTGTVILSNSANTYSGGTVINAGQARFALAGSIPSTGNVTISNGATMAVGNNNVASWTAGTVATALSRTTTGSNGTFALATGGTIGDALDFSARSGLFLGAAVNTTYNGVLTPSGGTYRLGGGGATLTVAGAILSGSNNLHVSGSGTVVLATSNANFTGTTLVDNGATLRSSTSLRLPAGTALTVNGSGIFDLGNTDSVSDTQTIASLAGSGTVTINSGNRDKTLSVNGTASTTFSGNLTNASQVLGLIKANSGTLVLSGTGNTYNGTTSVQAGGLVVTGSITNSATTITGGFLGGNGTVQSISLASGGRLAPGVGGIGTLNASNLLWDGGGIMQFDLSNANNSSDRLALSGSFTRGAGSGFVFDFQNSGFSTGTPVVYTMLTFAGSSGFSASDFSYTNLGSGLSGTFSLNSGSLEFSVIPEPSVVGLLALGLGIVLVRRRFLRGGLSSRR